jgi:hypothetical protein
MSGNSLATSFFVNKGKVDQFGYKVILKKRTNKSSTVTGFATYVRHFRLYESLLSKFMYIEGLIIDGGGIIQRLGVQPGDIMEIDIYKDPSDPIELKITNEFVIEQLGGEDTPDGQKSTRYTFRAVSKVGYEGLKNKVKKSFERPGTDIVRSVATEYLRVEPGKIKTFTETFGEINYIAPSVSPFQVIEHIAIQSISKDNQNDTTFFFYETRDGVYFQSLENIVKNANTFPYIVAVSKNRDDENVSRDFFRVQKFSHHNTIDQRENTVNGLLKNKTISFNPINRTINETTFNLKEEFKNIIQLGPHLLMDGEEIDNYVGDEDRFTDEEQSVFVRCSNESYDQVQDYISAARPVRQAQRLLMNQTALTVTIHGNPRMKPGDIIDLDINQPSGDSKQERDMILAGKYLVGSCVHSITDAKDYITICDLFKDGYERSIADYRRDINSHFVKPRA